MKPNARRTLVLAATALLLGLASMAQAQQIASLDTPSARTLPDAPQPSATATEFSSSVDEAVQEQTATPAASQSNGQTKRILGIIPNFRAATSNEKLPPQTVKEKFVTASEDSFDYSAAVLPTVLAFYGYEENKYPEFGRGGAGFGRYLWRSAVDQTVENYMVEFVVPAATHEDTRFYTLGHGGFLKRSGYALSRVVVTRNDSGHNTFNAGEVVGAALGASLSNAYYPAQERSFSNTGSQWGLNVGIDAGVFLFKEFWPDINSHLLHQKN